MWKATKILFVLGLVLISGCKTKDDVLREKQVQRLAYELRKTRAAQANAEQNKQELQMEITRLSSLIEAQSQRIDRLEQQLARGATAPRPAPTTEATPDKKDSPPPPTYAAGKAYFDKGQYVRAMAVLKRYLASAPKSAAREKAHFLLAESYYANKDFALAALEFNKYKRAYPRSKNLPTAIFRQAASFRSMGKKTEARLFYQELLDRFPKHSLAKRARKDIKSVK